MENKMYHAKKTVRSVAELQRILGPILPSQKAKIIDHIDDHCRSWIERSPFITVASANAAGQMDVSPKGDPAGFVKVLDPKTLVVPDRLGNRRGDTFMNVLENSYVSLMFIVPLRKEVVRVNGLAQVVMDDELLDLTTLNGHRPDLVLLVRVQEAFFHCGKSMVRSAMWQPEKWGTIAGLPSYAQALKDHASLAEDVADIDIRVADNEINRLY
jgi:PPOX class probable FMN-dependent enzyme